MGKAKKSSGDNLFSENDAAARETVILHQDAGIVTPQTGADSKDKEPVFPVIHEEISVKKRLVETGKVRISKKVIEEDEVVDVSLTHDEIDIQTIPVNRYVETAPDAIRYEGDTMIVSVLKEVTVVRLLLEKEIRITKKRIQATDVKTVTLRREEVVIERSASAASDKIQNDF